MGLILEMYGASFKGEHWVHLRSSQNKEDSMKAVTIDSMLPLLAEYLTVHERNFKGYLLLILSWFTAQTIF